MIVAYKGQSLWPSRLIRFMHRAPYSHVAWMDDDTQEVYEAWSGGVRRVASIHAQHTPGTRVDVFRVKHQQHHHTTTIRHIHLAQLGKPYDWAGVCRFVTRGWEDEPDNPSGWFCSRLVMCAHRLAGLPILERVDDWNVFPSEVTYSPNLTLVKSTVVEDVTRLDYRKLTGAQTIEEILAT